MHGLNHIGMIDQTFIRVPKLPRLIYPEILLFEQSHIHFYELFFLQLGGLKLSSDQISAMQPRIEDRLLGSGNSFGKQGVQLQRSEMYCP